MSDLGNKGRARGGMGLHLGVIRAELVKTVIKLTLGDPGCQVRSAAHLERKSSHTLFVVLPGPAGCAHVAVEIRPECLAQQLSLMWVEQKAPQ